MICYIFDTPQVALGHRNWPSGRKIVTAYMVFMRMIKDEIDREVLLSYMWTINPHKVLEYTEVDWELHQIISKFYVRVLQKDLF